MKPNNNIDNSTSKQADHTKTMPEVEGPASVLLIAPQGTNSDAIGGCVRSSGHRCTPVGSLDAARTALSTSDFDLVLLDTTTHDDAVSFIGEARAACPWLRAIAYSRESDSEGTIEAIRVGATDYMTLPESLEDLPGRIGKVVAQGRSHRRREQKMQRLMDACETLRASKDEMSQQVDVLCSDLASAYRNIKDQMSTVEMTTEFRTLINQELDVEDMLRTTLEYILKKIGPTNGVVHLREDEGKYGIGAFVNFEWQDRNIMPSLEKLGEVLCGPMQGEDALMKFEDAQSFANHDGVDPDLFEDSEVVSFTCNRNGNCLAIVTLFRSSTTPFTDDMASMLDALRDILAEQLGRILRVYKRSTNEWPKDAEDEADWGDLAA